jgi:hypothetical protein
MTALTHHGKTSASAFRALVTQDRAGGLVFRNGTVAEHLTADLRRLWSSRSRITV